MPTAHALTLLGTGLIGMFYTMTLHKGRNRDRVRRVYSRSPERARQFAQEWDIPAWSTDLAEAIEDPHTDGVVVGLPNDLHQQAVQIAAAAGKAVLCTKPLGRNAAEARTMLAAVEKAGVFAGYLEDLVYPPKTLKALDSVRQGALGRVLWVRSRETHAGPHSDWFWDVDRSGGGALIDMGCHCVEIIRSFIGKGVRPVEAMCWADTLVHPVAAEDHAVALIRFANGSLGQVEVGWAFRGGMDLRDEVSGTEGTIWLNHWLRTGTEMFTAAGHGGYVAEKAEGDRGWLFPVGDEVAELGYTEMFADVLGAWDEGRPPGETFYDGYVVNAVLDACYASARSRRWEPVELEWREPAAADGGTVPGDGVARTAAGPTAAASDSATAGTTGRLIRLKEERMPDGRLKVIYKDPETGEISQRLEG